MKLNAHLTHVFAPTRSDQVPLGIRLPSPGTLGGRLIFEGRHTDRAWSGGIVTVVSLFSSIVEPSPSPASGRKIKNLPRLSRFTPWILSSAPNSSSLLAIPSRARRIVTVLVSLAH